MAQVFEELKNNQIINSQGVNTLKKYIHQKYPNEPAAKTAAIFADAIHKVIDANILQFDELSRMSIKKNLLKEVLVKKPFSINAFEIFETCAKIDRANDDFLECFTLWINQNQSQKIAKDDTIKLTTTLQENLGSIEISQKNSIESYHEQLPLLEDIPAPDQIIISLTPLKKNDFISPLPIKRSNTRFRILKTALFCIIIFTVLGASKYSNQTIMVPGSTVYSDRIQLEINKMLVPNKPLMENDLPPHLKYKPINQEALKGWLKEKDSTLAEDCYFQSILNAAKEHNIHALLMFAITGQEQAFVPASNVNAYKIANNPFNVYGSWEDYNTDIDDSARIASKTILNLSKDCPENEDPIKWINKKYAEDQNWHIGVSKIFAQLQEYTR